MKYGNFVQRKLKLMGIIGALLLIFSLGYHFGSISHPRISSTQRAHNSPCDLRQQACKVSLADGQEVELNITPKDIPSNELIEVTVKFMGLSPEQTYLSLTSLTQKNNFIRIPLNESTSQLYSARFKLVNFGPAKQEWLLLLKIVSSEKTITIPFKFRAD